jgi:hypothetical protein
MTVLLIGIVAVSAVSTAGDYIWFEFGVRHRMLAGLLHGAVLLASVGAVVGAAAGRVAAGVPAGTAAGIGGALVYYALAPIARGSAMAAAWGTVWILLAVLEGRVLRNAIRSWTEALARGFGAAVLSGVTFFAVVDAIWGRAPAGGRNYAVHVAAWCLAWAPGILAIGAPRVRRRQTGA